MLTKRQKEVLDFVNEFVEENEYSPSLEEITKHLKLSSVSTAHFHTSKLREQGYLEKEDNRPRSIETLPKETMYVVPLAGTIAAGKPIEAISAGETIAIPKSKVPYSKSLYALRVRGNSMIDEGINDGDVVLIEQRATAENGEKVVALVDNGNATLKKFYREKGRIRLQPANKNMQPMLFDNSRDVSIQGVVVDIVQQHYKPASIETTKETISTELPINTILHGDAVDVMSGFPPNCIDLTVTSPPYDELRTYNSYKFDFDAIVRQLYRITKRGGVVVWVVGDKVTKGNRSLTSFKQALFFQSLGFNVHDVMIYKKKNTPFMRSNAYTNCYEFMFVFSKGSPRVFNPLRTKTVRQGKEMLPYNKKADGVNKKILAELKPEKTLTNIWEYAVGLHGSTSDRIAFKHTAIFPEKLVEDHVRSWTNEKGVVFDPMCGSGTTCKIAALNNRNFIGCDISTEYVELAKERLRINGINNSSQGI